MRRIRKTIAISLFALIISACSVTEHTVGKGAQGTQENSVKAWYLLFGAVPLNKKEVNSKNLVPEGVTDYDIKVVTTFGDGLLGIVANILIPTTLSTQTVKVKY